MKEGEGEDCGEEKCSDLRILPRRWEGAEVSAIGGLTRKHIR